MPILRPSCKGFSNSGKVFKSVCSFNVCRFSSRIGVVTPKCFKCARAVFSASTTKSVSPTIACCSCGNRHGVSGAPKGVGIKYKIGFILATPKISGRLNTFRRPQTIKLPHLRFSKNQSDGKSEGRSKHSGPYFQYAPTKRRPNPRSSPHRHNKPHPALVPNIG